MMGFAWDERAPEAVADDIPPVIAAAMSRRPMPVLLSPDWPSRPDISGAIDPFAGTGWRAPLDRIAPFFPGPGLFDLLDEADAATLAELAIGLTPAGVIQDMLTGGEAMLRFSEAAADLRLGDAATALADAATGAMAAMMPVSARHLDEGMARLDDEVLALLGYHRPPVAGGARETDRVAAASTGGSGDIPGAGLGSGASHRAGGDTLGAATERRQIDPEGRPLTAPVIVDRDLTPDEIRSVSLSLNDSVSFLDPEALARLAEMEANGLHFMHRPPDGDWVRDVYISSSLSPSEAVRVEAHEGIGHGTRGWLMPGRFLNPDDLILHVGTDMEDTLPLVQMMEASFAKRGEPYGTFAFADENWADFIERLTTHYAETRSRWPAAAKLVRDLWNAHPMAPRSVQFYELASPFAVTATAAAALAAALEAADREDRPRSPLFLDGGA